MCPVRIYEERSEDGSKGKKHQKPQKPLWQQLGYPKPKSEASKGALSLVDNEIYSGIVVPSELPLFVRLDGWKFHGLTKKLKLKEPYDKKFAAALAAVAKRFFIPFNASLAYIFSDEINLLFLRQPSFQRIEKIDSVFAGLASAEFSSVVKEKGAFDCRCIPVRKGEILPYLIWRQAEAFRNHNNSWAFFVLCKKERLSRRAAARRLSGLSTRELFALCKKYRVDLNKTPAWQRAGVLLFKEKFKKSGWDPIKKKKVIATRYRVKENWAPPRFDSAEGRAFLRKILSDETFKKISLLNNG